MMPTDTQKLMQNKENIVSKINQRGPSLPVQIARETQISPLFASAYLSELYNERKIKMSHMKVGSSPLYYIPGQEAQLENFIQYLNHKEREAFILLKNQKLLEDERMEPAIRVAIRALKDFAIPLRIKVGEDSKLFWKFYMINDEEIKNIAQEMLGTKKKKKDDEKSEEDKQETLVKEPKEVEAESELKLEKPKEEKKEAGESKENQIEQLKQKIEEISNELKNPSQKKEKKKKPALESRFAKSVKDYLASRSIEIISIMEEGKKDLLGKVRIDSMFGKQDYLLVAKEKKKVSEEDITIALHKAQLEKMPALFIAPGEIDKKSIEHAEVWKNLVKFERMK